jgi:hypothetical protein
MTAACLQCTPISQSLNASLPRLSPDCCRLQSSVSAPASCSLTGTRSGWSAHLQRCHRPTLRQHREAAGRQRGQAARRCRSRWWPPFLLPLAKALVTALGWRCRGSLLSWMWRRCGSGGRRRKRQRVQRQLQPARMQSTQVWRGASHADVSLCWQPAGSVIHTPGPCSYAALKQLLQSCLRG